MATSPVLLINSITLCLASASSPDVKMTVRGLVGEKSRIHSIGMLLIDFTSRANGHLGDHLAGGATL